MAIQDAKEVTHFDAIGDVHGCYYELIELVEKLGYILGDDGLYTHPEGRKMLFLGDITDRGWYNSLALLFVYRHWKAELALWNMGNHDHKLFRFLKGNPVRVAHGLGRTVQEFETAWPFDMPREELGVFLLENVPTLIELDGGKAVSCHAFPGKYENDHIYGMRSGPENGRVEWWKTYTGPFAIFGHYWLNDTTIHEHYCCVDTSCCLGEELAALRYPEKEIVTVKAKEVYFTQPEKKHESA